MDMGFESLPRKTFDNTINKRGGLKWQIKHMHWLLTKTAMSVLGQRVHRKNWKLTEGISFLTDCEKKVPGRKKMPGKDMH
jgi:hypothetical protein